MSLTSSILNPITHKNVPALYQNRNTLHVNRKHGNHKIIPYTQLFNYGDVVLIQFSSDVITVPTYKSYFGTVEVETISGSLVSTRTGDDGTRYFFNFTITMGASYYDRCISFICTQGTDTLTSEPIYVMDLNTEIAKGIVKRIDYTNFDRVESDLNGFFIDWEYLTSTDKLLFIYIEGQDLTPKNKDEKEILEGSQSSQIVSASFMPGVQFKTNAVPVYMLDKLTAISMVDFVTVNEIEYLVE